MILYNMNVTNQIFKRFDFLETVAIKFIKPLLLQRMNITTMRSSLRIFIESIIGPVEQESRETLQENKMNKKKSAPLAFQI